MFNQKSVEAKEINEAEKRAITKYVESNERRVRTYWLDVPFRLLVDMYIDEDLKINPGFQRFFRWTPKQQSAFIESLLLGVPIPHIFVAEVEDGRWELIDGLQRVSTFLAFRGNLMGAEGEEKNFLKLTGLEVLDGLNGFGYKDLSKQLQLSIERVFCRTVILRNGTEKKAKLDLFTRINTGGSLLSDQEFRNCISQIGDSEFAVMLETLSENRWFKKYVTIGSREKEKEEDQEHVLRFLSMHDCFEEFEGERLQLGEFFTEYLKDAILDENYSLEEKKTLFRETFDLVSKSGVDYPFRSLKGERFTGIVYTGVLVSISRNLAVFTAFGSEFTGVHIENVRKIHATMVEAGLLDHEYRDRYVRFLNNVFENTKEKIAERRVDRNV